MAEQKVAKCPILDMGNQLCFVAPSGHETYLSGACEDPSFIGAKSGNWIFGMFQHIGTGEVKTVIASINLSHYKVLTPTHVLFRGKNG